MRASVRDREGHVVASLDAGFNGAREMVGELVDRGRLDAERIELAAQGSDGVVELTHDASPS